MSNSNNSNDSVFTTSFFSRIKTVLDEELTVGEGQCITRVSLVKKLGLDPKFRLESALATLIANGKIEGYEVRRGPKGGIGRIGELAERKQITPSTPELTDEFKGKLMAALQIMCDSAGTPVASKVIAAHMGNDKYKPLISASIRLDEFSDFEMKVGKGGGVRRIVEPVETDVVNDNSELEDEIESILEDDINTVSDTDAEELASCFTDDDDDEPITRPATFLEDLTSSMEKNVDEDTITVEELAEASNL